MNIICGYSADPTQGSRRGVLPGPMLLLAHVDALKSQAAGAEQRLGLLL